MIAAPRPIADQAVMLRWRVLVAAPPAGFGRQLGAMRAWLDHNYASRWAMAPAGLAGILNDAVAFYFADPETARAFIGRFSCGYCATPIQPVDINI